MKAKDVRIGCVYQVRVSGKLARVRLDAVHPLGGWVATNLDTNHQVRIRTAGRLRKPLGIAPPTSVTDLWRQWQKLKESNPGAVLLFLVGDRYEAYGDDATVCGEVLGVTISTWTDVLAPGNYAKTSVAEIPCGSLDVDIRRLVAAGHKVAVCERVAPGEAHGKPVETIIV